MFLGPDFLEKIVGAKVMKEVVVVVVVEVAGGVGMSVGGAGASKR